MAIKEEIIMNDTVALNIRSVKVKELRTFPVVASKKNSATEVKIDFNFGVDVNQKLFTTTQALTLHNKGNIEEKYFFIVASIDFGFEGIEIEIDTDKVTLPEGLIEYLFSISYATLRGILLEKLSGTNIDGFILPLIDAKEYFAPYKKDGEKFTINRDSED